MQLKKKKMTEFYGNIFFSLDEKSDVLAMNQTCPSEFQFKNFQANHRKV